MAKIIFTIDYDGTIEEVKSDILKLAIANEWTEEILNPDYDSDNVNSLEKIPNPVTPEDVARDLTSNFLKESLKSVVVANALKDAKEAIVSVVDSEVDKYTSNLEIV